MRKQTIVVLAVLAGFVLPTTTSVHAGLVLWNKLGSQAEVENSPFGPDGTFNGGGFVPGYFGGAYSADYTQDYLVSFPKEAVPYDAGCIEFWARLSGYPASISGGGHRPYFLSIGDGQSAYVIGFNANDGAGNGGLAGCAGYGFQTGTGDYDGWPYSAVLGAGQEEDWHHYALVWDENGIVGVADGTKKVAVFLDGQLNSGRWHVWPDNGFAPLAGGQLALLTNWLEQGVTAIDNIKTWDHAKTDFTDRFVEPPTIPILIDIKPGSDPNSINLTSKGSIPVAIFSTDTFDAATVDPLTVSLAGAEVRLRGRGTPMSAFEDVDGDGLLDLVLHVETEGLELTGTDVQAALSGLTFDGLEIRGVDTVRIVREAGPVPEPATLSLLVLGGLALIRRRRIV